MREEDLASLYEGLPKAQPFREEARRPSALYSPSPVQQEFHALTLFEAFYGGSAGPGKSAALRADPIQCGLVPFEHERCRRREIAWGSSRAVVLNLRRVMSSHHESFMRALELYTAADPGFRYTDQKNRIVGRFSSGLTVIWGHLNDGNAYMAHRSFEYVAIYWDELPEFEKESYDQMLSRIRTSDPALRHFKRSRSAGNPSPNWVRERFIDPAPEGRRVIRTVVKLSDGTTDERARVFIPAKLSDHPDPAFRRDYELTLRTLPKHIREAQLNGNWYLVAGAFFAEAFDPDLIVIKPFKPPKHWRRIRSMDWGLKSECVVYWGAITPTGALIVYRERTFNGKRAKGRYLSAKKVAEAIRDIEIAHDEWDLTRNASKIMGPADTQLWSDIGQDGGATLPLDMASVGVLWKKAQKGRAQCAQQVYSRLTSRDKEGRPMLQITADCRDIISTLPALPTDELKPDEPKKGGPDHWYDSLSYMCSELMEKSEEMPRKGAGGIDDDDDDEKDKDNNRRAWGRYGYGGR